MSRSSFLLSSSSHPLCSSFLYVFCVLVWFVVIVDLSQCFYDHAVYVCYHALVIQIQNVVVIIPKQRYRHSNVCVSWWECAPLREPGVALTDAEWKIISVRGAFFLISFILSIFFSLICMHDVLHLFQKLADVSRQMEGEKYILSSSYWGALHEIEMVLQPQSADSPTLASLRSAMYQDHFANRVTLDDSVKNRLHVLMHLLDPRYEISMSIFISSSSQLPPSFFLPLSEMARETRERPYCSTVEQSKGSVLPICASILSQRLPLSCLCPPQRRCTNPARRYEAGAASTNCSSWGSRCLLMKHDQTR